MVRSYVAAGVVGLLVGTGLLFAKSHSHRKFVFTPDESPVTVRGGSVLALSHGTDWTQIAPNIWEATQADTSVVSLDGVAASGGTMPQPYSSPSGLTTNWKITISFRQPDSATEDTTNPDKLFICTANPCKTSGPQPNPGTLYLIEEDATDTTYSQFTHEMQPIDKYWRLRYDLLQCNGASGSSVRDSACNHIHSIRVEGIASLSSLSPFHCEGGACDIGIGAPLELRSSPK